MNILVCLKQLKHEGEKGIVQSQTVCERGSAQDRSHHASRETFDLVTAAP